MKSQKEVTKPRNQGFANYLMMEESGAGSEKVLKTKFGLIKTTSYL